MSFDSNINFGIQIDFSMVINAHGVFVKQDDGTVKVYDFDQEGNWYDIPEEEQQIRRDAFRKQLEEYSQGIIG